MMDDTVTRAARQFRKVEATKDFRLLVQFLLLAMHRHGQDTGVTGVNIPVDEECHLSVTVQVQLMPTRMPTT